MHACRLDVGYNVIGTHPMSALLGHGTGQPAGQLTKGVVESYPIGTITGIG
jgi:hypothetical protein